MKDSADEQMKGFIEERYGDSINSLIFNAQNLGQIRSIDRAYEEVETPYVFHCEDDWRFLHGGFIEQSLALLAEDRKIINVWLRGMSHTSGHPVEPERIRSSGGIIYHRMAIDKKDTCQGFIFNPTLKRMSDYELAKPYQRLGSEGSIRILCRYLGRTLCGAHRR